MVGTKVEQELHGTLRSRCITLPCLDIEDHDRRNFSPRNQARVRVFISLFPYGETRIWNTHYDLQFAAVLCYSRCAMPFVRTQRARRRK